MSEELLYNQLYERTKLFDRTQFIKELMRLERENKQLKDQLQQRDEVIEEAIKQIIYMQENEPSNSNEYDYYCRKLLFILDILNKYENKE